MGNKNILTNTSNRIHRTNNTNHNITKLTPTMKWTSITSFVDRETGEAITHRHIDKKLYVKIKCNITHKKQSKDYGLKFIQWECEPNKQTEIKF